MTAWSTIARSYVTKYQARSDYLFLYMENAFISILYGVELGASTFASTLLGYGPPDKNTDSNLALRAMRRFP
jgi:hypothetical protein